MKLYYYAFSGHKWGLDRVKRAVALIKAFRDEGVEVQLLVNDFRAGLAAKELGVRDSVTIETIMDIDVLAQKGDVVFIDTPEEDRGRIERYSKEYTLFHIVDDDSTTSYFGEIVMHPKSKEFSSIIIDKEYFDILDKTERTLFFFGDADYDKQILSHSDFFNVEDMELLLGHYFFVKYEDNLAQIFKTLHEPEEYSELIRTSSRVITASTQCALEARAAQAEVIYMRRDKDPEPLLEEMTLYGIKIIDYFNQDELSSLMREPFKSEKKVPNKSSETALKAMNRINL